eukprot:6198455-Pleurochrysis_carterae.AAC.3
MAITMYAKLALISKCHEKPRVLLWRQLLSGIAPKPGPYDDAVLLWWSASMLSECAVRRPSIIDLFTSFITSMKKSIKWFMTYFTMINIQYERCYSHAAAIAPATAA